LVAVAIVSVFELPLNTRAALLFLSISSGAPLLPKRVIWLGGDPAYVFSLVVATSLLAIITVPISLQLLEHWLPKEISIASDRVAITIFNTFLLPLVAGMLLCRFAPTIADKINEPLLRISGIALLLGVLVIIFNSWGMLLALGMPTFLAFAGFTVLSLAIGHLFGGPEHHMSLAIACATRHIGLALLVAAKVRGPKTLAMVAAYLIVSGVVSAFYIRFLRNRFRLHNF
jgi:BASS family bile acid:Na+ symporter